MQIEVQMPQQSPPSDPNICQKEGKFIIPEHRKSPVTKTILHWLLYQAAHCGYPSEGHWQIAASLQGGSWPGLLQLKVNSATPTFASAENSKPICWKIFPHPDFYSILDTGSVWNNSNQRALPKRKWSHFIQLFLLLPKHKSEIDLIGQSIVLKHLEKHGCGEFRFEKRIKC